MIRRGGYRAPNVKFVQEGEYTLWSLNSHSHSSIPSNEITESYDAPNTIPFAASISQSLSYVLAKLCQRNPIDSLHYAGSFKRGNQRFEFYL